MRLLAFLILAVAACGSSPGDSPRDLGAPGPDLAACVPNAAFKSDCGKPCDKGNSLGVGQFCTVQSDCANNDKAFLCTQIADPNNFFCTFGCKADGGPDQCGENARCACSGDQCGCFPTRCDAPEDMK